MLPKNYWREERLELMVTTRCNIQCAHCCGSYTSNGDDIGQYEAEDVIKEYADAGGQLVVISGGEPTLIGYELLQLISYANELGLQTSLSTNGWWGNISDRDDFARRLNNAGLDSAFFSCNVYQLSCIPWHVIKKAMLSLSRLGISVNIDWRSRYLQPMGKSGKEDMDRACSELSAYIPDGDIKGVLLKTSGARGPKISNVIPAGIYDVGRASLWYKDGFKGRMGIINNWDNGVTLTVLPGLKFCLNCFLRQAHSIYTYKKGHLIEMAESIIKWKLLALGKKEITRGPVWSCSQCSAIKTREREAFDKANNVRY